MKLRPFGVLLGILGNLMLILSLHELIGSTEFEEQPSGGYVAMVPLGILVSIAAVFFGGSFVTFLGIFLSIGIGSLWAGIDLPSGSEQKSFAMVFGGLFAGIPLLLTLLSVWGLRAGKDKMAQALALVETGGRAIGTVTDVRDTGMTINENPTVEITMRLVPEDGSAPFDATKRVTVSRVEIPRPGDRFPAFYDRADPTKWGYGDDMDPTQAPPDIQALFEKAAAGPTAAEDTTAALAKLAELHRAGQLTDAEFTAAKAKVISGA